MSAAGEALLERWRSEKDMDKRDELYEQLVAAKFFPKEDVRTFESSLYPEYDDPDFSSKILSKREFRESAYEPLAEKAAEGDACRSAEDFELSPVQRFVQRFLSPRTPYNSALLFHGVGVGKTCAAVSIAESYLEMFPRRKIFITAPPTIQAGFKTTIFDSEPDSLQIPADEDEPNRHRGCTGNLYLELTNSMYEKTRSVIQVRAATRINQRYEFFGYTQLYKFILKILNRVPVGLSAEEKTQRENAEIQKEFSGRVLIIDEAHNLRDLPDESEDDNIDAADISDKADAAAGKKLTPYLQRVLDVAEGLTLVLLTATPMYNSYREIIFLLNLLLRNDKRARLNESDVFYTSGVNTGKFKPGGEELLGRIASCYVSYMRGENPLTFPVRLPPLEDIRLKGWATVPPDSREGRVRAIPEGEQERCLLLPIVGCEFEETTERQYKQLADATLAEGRGGLGITNVDLLIQSGNWIFPANSEDEDVLARVGLAGFERTFRTEKKGSETVYTAVEGDASWLREDRIAAHSGKAAFLLKQLKTCKGIAFIYSRFVASGALSIALALEANGYTPWKRETGLLGNGIQMEGGRQCSVCEKKEREHRAGAAGTEDHAFSPAYYVLLTGLDEISPNNAAAIKAARRESNSLGKEIKVVIGSQIAGEGLDLKFVREIYVYDSWFHLNKLEQVIGRGVRNCSHKAFSLDKRTCTIYLLVNTYTETPDTETIDMYSYRRALQKAIQMGKVTRVLKRYALDCSLNYAAIRVEGLPTRTLVDGQGVVRPDVDLNDVEFSPLCDWIECDYACVARKDMPLKSSDTSTYDEYAVRWRISQIKKTLANRFDTTTFIKQEDLESWLGNIPRILLGTILMDIVSDPSFILYTRRGAGRLIYKNGYYLFQPIRLENETVPLPLAVRMAALPVKRDNFEPRLIEKVPEIEVKERGGEEGAGEGEGGEGVRGESLTDLWEAAEAWASAIERGEVAGEEMPEDLYEQIKRLSAGNSKVLRQRKERLDMVCWFYPVLEATPSLRSSFAQVLREYIWDEFLNTDTQKELYFSGNASAISTAPKTTKWELEGTVYLRFFNDITGDIDTYLTGAAAGGGAAGGMAVEKASAAVLEILEEATDRDPIRSRPIRASTTGAQYGFLVKKKNDMIFKIATPPVSGKEVARGARCSIDSNISFQIGKLVELGKILQGIKAPDLDLREEVLTKLRPFKNSTRACTLIDLALRCMDIRRVLAKRWFYRPLEAKLLGHKQEA